MPEKILIADSVDLALNLEEQIFNRSGLDILTCRSGLEALELIKEHKPRVVVIDHKVTGISGEDCCRNVKNDPDLKATVFFFMVENPKAEMFDRLYELNCDGIFLKPLVQQEVLDCLTSVLNMKVRKLARLSLKTKVQITHGGKSWVAESQNMNRENLLVSFPKPFLEGVNYHLQFSLGPEDPNKAQWARLEKQVAPGEGKNTTTNYLCLFRFLNVPDNVGGRIDQLAQIQNRQRGMKTPSDVSQEVDIDAILSHMTIPLADYKTAAFDLYENLNRHPPLIHANAIGAVRSMFAGLKPWEKKAFDSSSPEDEAVLDALVLRIKMVCDTKMLSGQTHLTQEQQEKLKSSNEEYFKLPERILETLQDAIDAHMQANNVELMKSLNVTKTDCFRDFVALKALINRILDPQAAKEASQYTYQATEADNYQVSSYNKPKVIEEKAEKPKEQRSSNRQGQKSKVGQTIGIVTLLIVNGLIGFMIYKFQKENPFLKTYNPKKRFLTVEKANLTFQAPIPLKEVREKDKSLMIIVTNDWDRLYAYEKKVLVKKVFEETMAKGYTSMAIYSGDNLLYASGSKEKGLTVLEKNL